MNRSSHQVAHTSEFAGSPYEQFVAEYRRTAQLHVKKAQDSAAQFRGLVASLAQQGRLPREVAEAALAGALPAKAGKADDGDGQGIERPLSGASSGARAGGGEGLAALIEGKSADSALFSRQRVRTILQRP